MKITEVRVYPTKNAGNLLANASITIDDEFVVSDVKVVEGQNGRFIAMPSKKLPDGKFKDIAFPVKKETREAIEAAVLAKYEEEISKA